MKISLFIAGLALVIVGIAIHLTHMSHVRKLTYGMADLGQKQKELFSESSLKGTEMDSRQAQFDKMEAEYYERGISVGPYLKAQEQSKYYFGVAVAFIAVGVVLCVRARKKRVPTSPSD